MARIVLTATLLTCAVIALTQVASYAVWGDMVGGYEMSIVVAGILIPLSTCFPISMYLLLQRDRLAVVVARLESAHRELKERSARDPMTGLLCRQAFFETLNAKACEAGSVLMIDVDHFKTVNDTHGHAAGDVALQLIARAFETVIGDKGVVARFGGEEFCVFLPLVDASEGLKLGEQIRRQVGRIEFSPGASPHRLTVSVGIASHRFDESVELAISAADAALYEAKKAGRNRVVRSPGQSRTVQRRDVA